MYLFILWLKFLHLVCQHGICELLDPIIREQSSTGQNQRTSNQTDLALTPLIDSIIQLCIQTCDKCNKVAFNRSLRVRAAEHGLVQEIIVLPGGLPLIIFQFGLDYCSETYGETG